MSTPVIAVQGVTKRFGVQTAVDTVSLDLAEGEFFALLGPSGCGKTTLLRVIAGFEDPDAGRVMLDGKDMTPLRANRRPVNLMFQSYALFPHMSVRANVAYGLEMESLAKREVARRVDAMLETVQLGELERRKPHQLSGGQRQRVALARALVKNPRVLLLDEPLGALDKNLREQMQLELKRLQHELGITFVVVTHDQEEALVMADRIALMRDGRIAQLDTPQALYERPNSRFAASFIGETNLFEGRAAPGAVDLDELGLHAVHGDVAAGDACALSVRPERIRLSVGGPLDGCNAIRGEIADIAYHGNGLRILLDVAGRDANVVARLSAGEEGAANCSQGQAVWCNWRPEDGCIVTEQPLHTAERAA